MARPDYIVRLHAAKYEWRYCSGVEKDDLRAAYEAVLEEISRKLDEPPYLIEAAVEEDFRIWVRQEKLPKLPPPDNQPSLGL